MTRQGRAEDQEELRKKKKRTGKRKRTSDLAAKACKAMQSHFIFKRINHIKFNSVSKTLNFNHITRFQ